MSSATLAIGAMLAFVAAVPAAVAQTPAEQYAFDQASTATAASCTPTS